MQAGKLDQRITLSRPARVQNDFGEAVEAGQFFDPDTGAWTAAEDYVAPIVAWASVRQQGAAERQRNGITTADNAYTIRIRYVSGIDASYVIDYRGRRLAITSVIEAGQGNREWLEIAATESK